MHCEEVFDPVNLFLSPWPSPQVGCCSGFMEPVFLNWSSSRSNVNRAGIFLGLRWQNCFQELMRTLDWHNFFILQNNHFAPSHERGRWISSAKFECSTHHSLSAGSLSELQNIAWRSNVPIPTIWACTHVLTGKKSNAPARA